MFMLLQILWYENIRNESEKPAYFSESFVHKSVNGSKFPGSKSIPFCCLCSQPQRWSSQDCIIAGPSHTVTRSFPGCDRFQGAVRFPWKQICCLTQYYPHPHVLNYHYSQYLTLHYFKYSFGQQKMV